MAAQDVNFDDVQARTEFDLTTRFARDFVEVLIADAVALIVDECPTVPSRLASGALSPNNYKRVVSDVVKRIIRNPEGLSSESEGGYSYTANAAAASGTFWLTDRDRRTLNGVTLKSTPGVVSIGLDYGWSR
jgi:aminopeptidase N